MKYILSLLLLISVGGYGQRPIKKKLPPIYSYGWRKMPYYRVDTVVRVYRMVLPNGKDSVTVFEYKDGSCDYRMDTIRLNRIYSDTSVKKY